MAEKRGRGRPKKATPEACREFIQWLRVGASPEVAAKLAAGCSVRTFEGYRFGDDFRDAVRAAKRRGRMVRRGRGIQ